MCTALHILLLISSFRTKRIQIMRTIFLPFSSILFLCNSEAEIELINKVTEKVDIFDVTIFFIF